MIHRSALRDIAFDRSPSDFALQGCLNPIKRKIRFSENGEETFIYVPCGHCLRCRDNKRNDLASRMFLHSLDYEYVYFVTLTYGSANLLPFKQHPFLSDWLATVPTYDTCNSSGANRWSPTLLVRSHLTKFLKRLRVSLNSQITYAACGEYGSKFNRPHFHVLIWSHEAITKEQFKNAWSLDCMRTGDKYVIKSWRGASSAFKQMPLYKQLLSKYQNDIPVDVLKKYDPTYFKFSIGDVDFEDLWKNGTLNYDGQHPGELNIKGSGHNAMHNFTYLAKYVGKGDDYYINPILKHRFDYAYALYCCNYSQLEDLNHNPSDDEIKIFQTIQNSLNYESKNISFDGTKYPYFSRDVFQKIVSPFFVSSRRPSIGKSYYLKNRARFQRKEFGLQKFMDQSIQFPRYFFYLLAQDQYPIRIRKDVPSGVSLTKDLLPRLHTHMSAMRENQNYWYAIHGLDENANYHPRFDRPELYSTNGLTKYINLKENELHKLYGTNSLDCIDFLDPAGCVIHYFYHPVYDHFEGYTFNRSTRQYDFADFVPREDFCDMVLDQIEGEYKQFIEKKQNVLDLFTITDLVENDELTLSVRERYIKYRLEHQLKYDAGKFNPL